MSTKPSQLHLNWNNFGDNLIKLVKEFRDDQDFHDVTLLCEDGVMIPANKFLLSCCSSFFKFVFKRTLQANVVIYLKGVKGNHMKSILDFIYFGFTNVPESQLTPFLQSANDLKICGLVETSRKISDDLETEETEVRELNDTGCEIKTEASSESPPPLQIEEEEQILLRDMTSTQTFASENEALNRQESISDSGVSKYLEKRQSGSAYSYFCTICGKSFAYKHVLENHIETHMDCSYPCDICHKNFKTRNSLKSHLSQRHRNGQQSTQSLK